MLEDCPACGKQPKRGKESGRNCVSCSCHFVSVFAPGGGDHDYTASRRWNEFVRAVQRRIVGAMCKGLPTLKTKRIFTCDECGDDHLEIAGWKGPDAQIHCKKCDGRYLLDQDDVDFPDSLKRQLDADEAAARLDGGVGHGE